MKNSVALTFALALGASGCVADPVTDESTQALSASSASPADFCDEGNPCTTKANCTPCSTLPAAERDMWHCTADDELPPFCAGRTGCVQVPLTTPTGQVDSCFPVAGADDLRAGVCRAGACVDVPVEE